MKIRSTMMLVMAGLLASCTNSAQPFAIQEFFPLTAGCGVPTTNDAFVSGGVLDVAAGAPQFFVGVRVIFFGGSTGTGPTQLALKTGEVLESANRNRPLITQQVVTYRLSKRIGGTPKPFILNRSFPFNDKGEIIGPIQLISLDFGNQLFDGLTASSNFEDFVDVQCDVEFKGEYSATRTPFSTGTLTFPIRVFRSAPTACPAGQQFRRFVASSDGGVVDPCAYVGQANGVVTTPAPPSACCVTGSTGC
jgi:hypothetical protein